MTKTVAKLRFTITELLFRPGLLGWTQIVVQTHTQNSKHQRTEKRRKNVNSHAN